MSVPLIIFVLCVGADFGEPAPTPVSVASNPARRVRLHVAASDITTRVIDTATQQVVCVGPCDELLSAESDAHFRVVQAGLEGSEEFGLAGFERAAVFAERPRNWTMAKLGIVVTGAGVVAAAVGVLLVLVSWAASGNGLTERPWTQPVMHGGGFAFAVGAPLAVVGLPFLLYGLRHPLEVTEGAAEPGHP